VSLDINRPLSLSAIAGNTYSAQVYALARMRWWEKHEEEKPSQTQVTAVLWSSFRKLRVLSFQVVSWITNYRSGTHYGVFYKPLSLAQKESFVVARLCRPQVLGLCSGTVDRCDCHF
jgi:hypothetical protein